MEDSTLNRINADIDAIRKDPKYIALKNKKRTAQDTERYNAFLRQLARLETQRNEHVTNSKNSVSDEAKFLASKPVWKNQPAVVAHRNQDAGAVSRNWVPETAKPLDEAHPEVVAKTAPVEEPVAAPSNATPARLMVHRLLKKKVVRTPGELKRFSEQTHPKNKIALRATAVYDAPRSIVERIKDDRAATRRTAPPAQAVEEIDDLVAVEVEEEVEEEEEEVEEEEENENVELEDDLDE